MTVARFTPSMMKHDDLEAIFVQRQELAQDIVDKIRESALTPSKHSTLLIGSRGMGKTYLVTLAYHRVRQLDECKDRLLIAWLREEEWGVTSFLDLLLRIFRALKEENGDLPVKNGGFSQQVESLYDLAPDAAERAGLALLKEVIGDRTLLLLMENLDELFEGLGKEGQKQFRSFLQKNACSILATAQSLSNNIQAKSSPFYGFFKIHPLQDLTVDEATELLANIAKLQGKSELESFIKTSTGRDRIKAVHHLAGGNPRIYVIFSEFLTKESLAQLVEVFKRTLDDLTPYYQDRMKYLSPQQRKIVEFLCDRRHGVTVKEIAQRCFMTHQTASSQLKKLLEMGYVRSESIGRESYYELREVLMRFCLEVKKQRGEPISLIVDLLRSWYTREELKQQWESCLTLRKDVEKFDKTSLHPSLAESLRQTSLEQEYLRQALQPIDTEEDPRVAAYIEEFSAFVAQRDFVQALRLAEKLVLIRGDAEDWLSQGSCLCELKRYEEAIASYEKALAINPDDDYTWFFQGFILRNLGRLEEAIASFDKALAINSDDDSTWFFRGITLSHLGRLEEAITSYNQALAINSEYDSAWYFRGKALDKLGRLEEAIASFDKALAINPDDDRAWCFRGNAMFNLGRLEEAIVSFDKALTINPNDDNTWCFRGNAMFNLGRLEEAIVSFDKALTINPDDDNIWCSKGIILNKLGRLEEAIASFNKALTINPDDNNIWYFRGNAMFNLGRLEEAIVSFDKALTINPDDNNIWCSQGIILSNLGRWKEAIASFDKALVINPDDENTWCSLGIILSNSRRWEEAITSFDKALTINPEYDSAWYFRGKALSDSGKLEEAIISYEKALAINPDQQEIWSHKGWLLDLLGRYEEALISCNKAIELGANDSSIFFNRAIAILGLNWSEGITALEDAINRTKTKDEIFADDTELIIRILFKSVQDSAIWKTRLLPIIQLYENHQVVSELAQGMVKNIPALMSEMVSDKAAQTWLEVWQEIVGDAKEFEIPLRLLKTAVEYKVKKGDRRVLLELPIEERKLLTEELKIEEVYKK